MNVGLIVGWLLAFEALLTNGRAAWLESPIWACVVAVLVSFMLRQASGCPHTANADQDS